MQELLQKSEPHSSTHAGDEGDLLIDDSDDAVSDSTPESMPPVYDEPELVEAELPEPELPELELLDSGEQPAESIVAAEYSLEPEPEIDAEAIPVEEEIVSQISGELENIHAVLDVDEVDEVQDKSEQSLEVKIEDELVELGTRTADEAIEVVPVVETLEVLKPGSDPEILEIYLEEAEEESENIARLQQDWLFHPEDQNALKNIRRAFHTIKGSGRLVGAVKIGEFAWDYEQLLNSVIDKTIAPNDAIIDAVGKAAVASLELVEELKNGQPVRSDIAYLRGLARALATFDADQVRIERTGVMQISESPYDRITDDDEFGLDVDGFDETMFSSPDPLQETMVISEQDRDAIDLTEADLNDNSERHHFDESDIEESLVDSLGAQDYALDHEADVELYNSEQGLAASEEHLGIPEPELEESIEISADDIEFESLSSLDDVPMEEISLEAIEEEVAEEDFEDLSELDVIEELEIEAVQQQVDEVLAKTDETPPDPFVQMTGNVMPGEGAGISEADSPGPHETTDLSIDPELLTIYQQEVEQHLSIVNSALELAENSGELIPSEDVYRALHTIHGASRTADISSIGELAAMLEKPLKAAMTQSLALDRSIVTLYRQGCQSLRELTAELVETRRLPSIPVDLKDRLLALAEDLEEHTVELPDDHDQANSDFVDTLTMMSEPQQETDNELLSIFIDEANELLEMSDHTLHRWADEETDEDGNHDYTAVMELQRYLHTLKGGAKMAELEPISDLSHELESMFIAVIDNRVEKNEDLVDLLKESFDLLHRQVSEAQENKPLTDSSIKVTELKNIRRSGNTGLTEEITEDEIEPGIEEADIVPEGFSSETAQQTSERQAQDVIRVRSDLLDNLVNSAGEVSIYRARMEQQVAGLGSHLGELGQTIMRLKNQLRSLEAETDAQIHFSHQTHAKHSDDFDPLEMDRYTMIQELSRSLSESVNDLSSLQNMLGEQVKDSETLLLQQSRVNTDLQDGLIKSRMVKFSGLLSRLRRLVRQNSQELAKKAELVVSGEENEVDNKVLDRMVAPLEHIIRNALSHGIEAPVERVKKGKPEVGRISIDISRDGSDIVIRASDDGGGVNLDKVRSRALQLGLIDHDQTVAEADLVQYILEPGFSTADHVTQLSGRGVGMDVVDIEIKQLGGTLQIESDESGTTFIARLPFTLSINQAILVRTGEETYAIPLINIEGITRLETYKLVEHYQSENPELDFSGQKFTLHYLSQLVGESSQFNAEDEQFKQPVILIRSGDVRVALHVDELLGNREIVVKSLGKQLSQVKGLAGASILADGSVVLILDVNGLVRHSSAGTVKVVYRTEPVLGEDATTSMQQPRSTVMVVDDSITMRRVASKLLERNNYRVVTAKDGVDALAQLEDVQPDIMLLDIEMPRMDGFELASHMQNEDQYSKIPIIMITSRTGEKHRDRALEIGVTSYMGKPYQEDELIQNIQSALGA